MNTKTKIMTAITIIATGFFGAIAEETPAIGEKSPGFKLPDLDGNNIELASFKDKYVVLEWVNYDCPFVVKHYKSGNMQALQNEYMEKGVAWLVINSSAPGKQGYFAPDKWKELAAERKSTPTAILLDTDGKVGKLYRARTTPHMFIINPEGVLVYMGAIDDKSGRDMKEIETAKNYVRTTLDAAMEGKPVEPTITKPYGCSVKY